MGGVLTFWRAVDDLVLLLSVLQNAFRTEHVPVLQAVELNLLRGVLSTKLNLAFRHLTGQHGRVGRSRHWKSRKHLVVDWQVVGSYLMVAFVVRTLNHSVLGEFTNALRTERVTTRKRSRLLFVMVVRFEADSTLKDRIHFGVYRG